MANWTEITIAIASSISASGIFLLYNQFQQQAKIARASFLDSIAEDAEKYLDMLMRIDTAGDLFEKKILSHEEKQELIKILNFFERLQIFLMDNVVDIKNVDRMFSYRFFSLVHNTNVQEQILNDEILKPYWALISNLRDSWLKHREKLESEIPFLERYQN